MNDILIDVIIPKKINNLPSYLFNEDFYAGCAIFIRRNKYFQVQYGNEQVSQRKNYGTRFEAMKLYCIILNLVKNCFNNNVIRR